jgi:hypothetical protein
MASKLLELLRDEAVSLADAELPSLEELRPLVGAVVNRLERLEQELVGELKPAPVKPPAVDPAVASQVAVTLTPPPVAEPVAPVPVEAAPAAPVTPAAPPSAAEELEAAKQRVAELEAQQASEPSQ